MDRTLVFDIGVVESAQPDHIHAVGYVGDRKIAVGDLLESRSREGATEWLVKRIDFYGKSVDEVHPGSSARLLLECMNKSVVPVSALSPMDQLFVSG